MHIGKNTRFFNGLSVSLQLLVLLFSSEYNLAKNANTNRRHQTKATHGLVRQNTRLLNEVSVSLQLFTASCNYPRRSEAPRRLTLVQGKRVLGSHAAASVCLPLACDAITMIVRVSVQRCPLVYLAPPPSYTGLSHLRWPTSD